MLRREGSTICNCRGSPLRVTPIANFPPTVYLRTSGGGTPVATTSQPTTTEFLRDVAVDVNDWQKAYVVTDAGNVFATSNAGASWSNVTGNLSSGSTSLWTITHIPGSPSLVAVGGVNGVFRMATNNAGVWNQESCRSVGRPSAL